MHQSKLDCGGQKRKTNRRAPVLTVSMACQIKCITLCCSVHLQPFMIHRNERKETGCWESVLPPSASKLTRMRCKFDHLLPLSKLEWWDQRGKEQLCKCTHSVWCCPINLFCQHIRNRGEQPPVPRPHRMNKTFPKTIRLSLTRTVKSHGRSSDGCLLETPALPLSSVSGRKWGRGSRQRGPLSVLSHLNNVASPRPPHHHLWTFSHGSAAGKSDNWLDCCTVRETLFFSYLIRDSHTAALKFQ